MDQSAANGSPSGADVPPAAPEPVVLPSAPLDAPSAPMAVDPAYGDDPDASAATASAGVAGESAPVEPPLEDELPVDEPLSPELLEDEAIRGDVVIRWAVMGLALLIGLSPIDDSRTLLHVRTGEYLSSHGYLPPAVDVFSMTASERPWINLSWLFDLAVAGVHTLGGGLGLTLLQGGLLLAAISLSLAAAHPGIRHWWGSVATAGALLACAWHFHATPTLITLVGLAFVGFWITRCAEADRPAWPLWSIIPVFALWAQLDPRAFLGAVALLAYLAGQRITPAARRGWPNDGRDQRLTLFALVAVLALAVHPFPGVSLTNIWNWYLHEYPAQREALSASTLEGMLSRPVWDLSAFRRWNAGVVSGLALMGATAVCLLLNAARVSIGHVLLFVTMNGLALLGLNELAPISLLNAVLATVHAQEWFYTRGGQRYDVTTGRILFSRGGRALTVLALMAVAFAVISGRFDGPDGRRTGLGWHPELANLMEDYASVTRQTYGPRGFHAHVRQGDLLIWNGHLSFVDSRAGLFYRADAANVPPLDGQGHVHPELNILAWHNQLRQEFRTANSPRDFATDAESSRGAAIVGGAPLTPSEAGAAGSRWQQVFGELRISHVMPRLSGMSPTPDYLTFGALLANREWSLTSLHAVTGVFHWQLSRDEAVRDFATTHQLLLREVTYGPAQRDREADGVDADSVAAAEGATPTARPATPTEDGPVPADDPGTVVTERSWAEPPVATTRWVRLERTTPPNDVQLAAHFFTLAQSQGLALQIRLAAVLRAVQLANRGLRAAPSNAYGYEVLGNCHALLDELERSFEVTGQPPLPTDLRYLHAVANWQQALSLDPQNQSVLSGLVQAYQSRQRWDLARDAVREWRTRLMQSPRQSEAPELLDQLLDVQLNLEGQVTAAREALEKLPATDQEEPLLRAAYAAQNGLVLQAIEVLEADAVSLARNPLARAALLSWLIEAGRGREATERAQELIAEGAPGSVPSARPAVATYWAILGNYKQATRLWSEELRSDQRNDIETLLASGAFSRSIPPSPGAGTWPINATASTLVHLTRTAPRASQLAEQISTGMVEGREFSDLVPVLRDGLDAARTLPVGNLLRLLLSSVLDRPVNPIVESDEIPLSAAIPLAE